MASGSAVMHSFSSKRGMFGKLFHCSKLSSCTTCFTVAQILKIDFKKSYPHFFAINIYNFSNIKPHMPDFICPVPLQVWIIPMGIFFFFANILFYMCNEQCFGSGSVSFWPARSRSGFVSLNGSV